MEFGIWSDEAGGFIDRGYIASSDPAVVIAYWVLQGEDPADLQYLAICREHEEEQARHCEVCEEDDDE